MLMEMFVCTPFPKSHQSKVKFLHQQKRFSIGWKQQKRGEKNNPNGKERVAAKPNTAALQWSNKSSSVKTGLEIVDNTYRQTYTEL